MSPAPGIPFHAGQDIHHTTFIAFEYQTGGHRMPRIGPRYITLPTAEDCVWEEITKEKDTKVPNE